MAKDDTGQVMELVCHLDEFLKLRMDLNKAWFNEDGEHEAEESLEDVEMPQNLKGKKAVHAVEAGTVQIRFQMSTSRRKTRISWRAMKKLHKLFCNTLVNLLFTW